MAWTKFSPSRMATAHTAQVTIALLLSLYPGCLISKNGDFDWFSRLPDLTPSRLFPVGVFKEQSLSTRHRPRDREIQHLTGNGH